MTCGRSGIFGILTFLKVPIMSIMPLCVIKYGVLIFKEKDVGMNFCGLLRLSENVFAKSP